MSQTVKLIVIGVIASSLLGLCLVGGGVGMYIVLAGKSQAAAWEPLVAEKDRLRQEMHDYLQTLQSKHNGTIPSQERSVLIKHASELDNRITMKMHAEPQLRGKVPAEIGEKLGESLLAEVREALAVADQAARKKIAELAASRNQQQQDAIQQQIDAIEEAEQRAKAKQARARQQLEAARIESEIESYYEVPDKPGERRELTAEQEAIIAQMRAIETALRSTVHTEDQYELAIEQYIKLHDQMIDVDPQEKERLRRVAESAPGAERVAATIEEPAAAVPEDPTSLQPTPMPTDAPPPATPAVEPAPSVGPQQPVAAALPGFAVEQVSQLRAGVKVLVRNGDKWLPATIEGKRNKFFEVRYAPGDLAVVTPDRIRWQEDPAVQK